MKKLVASILPLAVAALLGSAAFAQEATHGEGAAPAEHEEGATPHYPLKHPREQDWSFAGPFGHYDKGQLQRGLKVYTEVCSACHSMSLVPFRMLGELGYSEAQVKAFAANYEVQDGPDSAGEMFTRKAIRPGRCRCEHWRGPAGFLADREGPRDNPRLPAVRLRYLHAVSGRRTRLYLLAADGL